MLGDEDIKRIFQLSELVLFWFWGGAPGAWLVLHWEKLINKFNYYIGTVCKSYLKLSHKDPAYHLQELIVLLKHPIPTFFKLYCYKNTYQNLNIRHSTMSLLSASHYQYLSQAIALLKAQMDEQYNQQLHQFELIAIKLKMIQQQTQQLKHTSKTQEKEVSAKIDQFRTQVKSNLKLIVDSYPKNEGCQDIQLQLRELHSRKEKLVQSSQGIARSTGQKLQSQIDELQQKVDMQNHIYSNSLRSLQSQLKKEIQITRDKLRCNQQLLDISSQVEQIQQIALKLQKELSEVRSKRIERKGNFLNLLETIVVKCKEGKNYSP